MLVLGIETSCDETGVALYDDAKGLLAHALHSQARMHEEYGGVVPELASRDHIRRVLPLVRRVLNQAGCGPADIDLIAYTQGPGLAGALLVGAAVACGLAQALDRPVVGVHHLEGHLLAPLLEAQAPEFPFVALLVSGGHTQLMEVRGPGRYRLLGETLDDAAGEAFDKSAKLLGLGYPGGPALARLAERGQPGRIRLPRPMLTSDDLDFSFSGLKTAVVAAVRAATRGPTAGGDGSVRESPPAADTREITRADIAAEVQEAIVEVLVAKSMRALAVTGRSRLVVAGGVGANARLRARMAEVARARGVEVYYPRPEFCTDNGAMIALAGLLRAGEARREYGFTVKPRWDLASLPPVVDPISARVARA